jgi:CRP/FNR family cyclic AMP-dependent transcriptional regulator
MPLVAASKKLIKFDTKRFLSTINGGRKIEAFPKKQTIFVQGDSSNAVFYIKEGKVKLTVVSHIGKEATIGILNGGDFFGEGCLTGQPLRLSSATAMTDCTVMKIDKKSMNDVLHREHAFSDMFVAYLLTRNIRYEEDLVDQLFNSSERRLARILLLLAHFGKEGKPEKVIPKMSQETLAEMIGTTRSRVSFFMNRFRKLGFVDRNHFALTRLSHRGNGISVCHLIPNRVTKYPRHDIPDLGPASTAELIDRTKPLLNNNRFDVVQVLAFPFGKYPLP